MKCGLLALAIWAAVTLGGVSRADGRGGSTGGAEINLQDRIGEIRVIERDGRFWVEHEDRTYSAEDYLALINAQKDRRDAGGPVYRVLNITTAGGVLWVGLGLMGQLLFTGRMLVQWLVSEKQGRSVVPPVFWWLSLAGATMLLAYFLWRKDIVGVIGQGAGWAIYARNVYLIRRSRGEVAWLGPVDDDEASRPDRERFGP